MWTGSSFARSTDLVVVEIVDSRVAYEIKIVAHDYASRRIAYKAAAIFESLTRGDSRSIRRKLPSHHSIRTRAILHAQKLAFVQYRPSIPERVSMGRGREGHETSQSCLENKTPRSPGCSSGVTPRGALNAQCQTTQNKSFPFTALELVAVIAVCPT